VCSCYGLCFPFCALIFDIKINFTFVSCAGGTEENTKASNDRVNGEEEEQSSNSNESSENEETEEGKLEFPDTEIKIEHVRGNQ
jgi:hypothetical protein